MMDPDWIPFHPDPKKPDFRLPPGAVDAHCHVFGPAQEFPFAKGRKYTPCDAGKDALFVLRDHLGFARNVIVQATCHGQDNRALLDALSAANGRARGVVSVGADICENELVEMDKAGVRGVRFNFVKRLVDKIPQQDLLTIADKIKPLGWHIVVYFEAQDIEELAPLLATLPTLVIVDHMGRPNVANGVDHPDFRAFIHLLERYEHIWTKVTCPERLSRSGPPYGDVVPFAAEIMRRFPDRVLWGTDWPHPNMKSHMPDDGQLVDYIPRIAPHPLSRQKLLVDNPTRLYWG